jgi:hypothetical protein
MTLWTELQCKVFELFEAKDRENLLEDELISIEYVILCSYSFVLCLVSWQSLYLSNLLLGVEFFPSNFNFIHTAVIINNNREKTLLITTQNVYCVYEKSAFNMLQPK